MSRPRIELIVCLALLIAIFILSLVLRISVPWDHVFVGDWVKFTDNDAYYYMRLLDNLARHFPQLSHFDPYNIYPSGRDFSEEPLFYVYMMGFFAWLFGGGAPSQHLVDLVGVYFPAVLGALLVFPVFLIGKLIFNKWAGLVAALLMALMPGEFLVRTLLGNTDIHVVELFFTTFFITFLLLAIEDGKTLKLPQPQGEGPRKLARPLVYSLLAGLCLGIYLLSWRGALLFVFISFMWLVVQTISDHLRGRSTVYLAVIGFTAYLVALALALTSPVTLYGRMPLTVALLASVLLPAAAELMRRRRVLATYYLVVVAGAGGIALLALYIASPQTLSSMLNTFAGFFRWNTATGVAEDQPLLINQGAFTLGLLWGNYTAASLLALVGIALVVYRAAREGEPGLVLLSVWSIVILLATLAMRRFAYYLAVNVAVTAGYTGWLILHAFGLEKESAQTTREARMDSKKARARARRQQASKGSPGRNSGLVFLGIILVALVIIYPNTGPLPGGERPFFQVASQGLNAPSDAWCESLDWLRSKSDEPFGDSQYYYENYITPPQLSSRAPAYSVVSWWDFGYWITRIGHRVPVSTPGSGKVGEQNLLLASSSQEAARTGANWNMRYLIVDNYLVDWHSGFGVLASNAGQPSSKYFEIYYRPQNDKIVPTLLYYPEYYQTLAVRLYCFSGASYVPKETAVIAWEPRQDQSGQAYKEITGLKTFPGYDEAVAFIAAQKTGNLRIVGKDPTVSPVPLENLPGFTLAFMPSTHTVKLGNYDIPGVKIFEYSGGAQAK